MTTIGIAALDVWAARDGQIRGREEEAATRAAPSSWSTRRKLPRMARYIGRENLRKRAREPASGRAWGGTISTRGLGQHRAAGTRRSPFGRRSAWRTRGLSAERWSGASGPLSSRRSQDGHVAAALLVRPGGFAVGVVEGELARSRRQVALAVRRGAASSSGGSPGEPLPAAARGAGAGPDPRRPAGHRAKPCSSRGATGSNGRRGAGGNRRAPSLSGRGRPSLRLAGRSALCRASSRPANRAAAVRRVRRNGSLRRRNDRGRLAPGALGSRGGAFTSCRSFGAFGHDALGSGSISRSGPFPRNPSQGRRPSAATTTGSG